MYIRQAGTKNSMLSFQSIYKAYDERNKPAAPTRALTAMQQFCKRRRTNACVSAFDRISTCRKALEALDRQGKERIFGGVDTPIDHNHKQDGIAATTRDNSTSSSRVRVHVYSTRQSRPARFSVTTRGCCKAMDGTICRRRY
jgi:hypothetical protein